MSRQRVVILLLVALAVALVAYGWTSVHGNPVVDANLTGVAKAEASIWVARNDA